MGFDASGTNVLLEGFQVGGSFPHGSRSDLFLKSIGYQQSGRLTDVPLHGMKPVASIGDVGSPDVLVGRQQVFHPLRNQRPQGNLEGQRGHVDVVVPTRGGMQIEIVKSHPHAVIEFFSFVIFARQFRYMEGRRSFPGTDHL